MLVFRELIAFCDLKRQILFTQAADQKQKRRLLNFVAGGMAIVSGASMTAILQEWIGGASIKVLTPLLAVIAGFINLTSSSFFDDKDAQRMFEGAGKFLTLREKLKAAMSRPDSTDKIAHDTYVKLSEEYTKVSNEFEAFMSARVLTKMKAPDPGPDPDKVADKTRDTKSRDDTREGVIVSTPSVFGGTAGGTTFVPTSTFTPGEGPGGRFTT